MPFLELLLSHKEFLIILVLLIFIGFGFMYVKVLHTENSELKANNATLTTSLTVSNKSIADLKQSVDLQNAAIDKMKAAAVAQQKAHAAALAVAQKVAATDRQRALDILKLKPTSTDKCQAANDLINKEILNAKH